VLTVYENVGCVASDSIVVIRDIGYFLGYDGVYTWSDDGITCISRQKVDGWFTTDAVFDRTQFSVAKGSWNPLTNCYELALVPIGGSATTLWIAFQIDTGEWLGPHSTQAFTQSCRGLLQSDDAVLRPAVGATDGFIYLQNQAGGQDVDGPTLTKWSIASSFTTRWITGADNDTNQSHYFGRLVLLNRVESAGTQLSITGTLGLPANPDGSVDPGNRAMAPITADLTLGRQVLGRVSDGNGAGAVALTFSQATAGQVFLLFGAQILESNTLGIR
jgi:hypothetical protein